MASSPGMWNRIDHRPLEGFVYAVTPFNFTAIAGNLPTAPALMGNTVVWKPSPTQQLAARSHMQLLEEAGLPPGVINLVTGDGRAVSEVLLADRRWPASTSPGRPRTFQHLWRTVGEQHRHLPATRGWSARPAARTSSSPTPARTSTCCGRRWSAARSSTRGRSARPRPGRTCRARSGRLRDGLIAETEALPMGDVADFGNFIGAVIDAASFDRLAAALDRAHATPSLDGRRRRHRRRHATGTSSGRRSSLGSDPDERGVLHRVLRADPGRARLRRRRVRQGARAGRPRRALRADRVDHRAGPGARSRRREALRFAAGNFYVNDKPTGAVVGQQPFGGGRASGTNDKAGSIAQPAPLDEPPDDQGDVRARDVVGLPAPGVTRHPP